MSHTMMTTESRHIEMVETTRYLRGYMALVWINGALVQVFSGGSKRDVEADAAQYMHMYRGGLL